MFKLNSKIRKEIEGNTYKTSDVLRACDLMLKRSTLDQWVARGFIIPAQETRGSGYPAEYSFVNLVEIVIMKELSESGLSKKIASKIAGISAKFKKQVHIDLFTLEVHERPKKYTLTIDVGKIRYELGDAMLPDCTENR